MSSKAIWNLLVVLALWMGAVWLLWVTLHYPDQHRTACQNHHFHTVCTSEVEILARLNNIQNLGRQENCSTVLQKRIHELISLIERVQDFEFGKDDRGHVQDFLLGKENGANDEDFVLGKYNVDVQNVTLRKNSVGHVTYIGLGNNNNPYFKRFELTKHNRPLLLDYAFGKEAGVDIQEFNFEKNNSAHVLDSAVYKDNKTEHSGELVLEVCSENWMGPYYGYPFYNKNWRAEKCCNATPFEKIITVILQNEMRSIDWCRISMRNVLLGLKKLYPKVRVIVGGTPCTIAFSGDESFNLHVVHHTKNSNMPGAVLNQLVKLVKTPYVLIGRNLEYFLWTSDLKRQVRVLSHNRTISISGGSVRNSTGHWHAGCYQCSMKNYILKYVEGYSLSQDSCMFCDMLTGSFVARTSVIKRIRFDETLPSHVVFEDWFWRLRQDRHYVLNCPDIMYLAKDPKRAKMVDRLSWIPLINKWRLNRVVLPDGKVFSYTCQEAGLSCANVSSLKSTSLTSSLAMPICCVEQLANAVWTFHQFCIAHNLGYEMIAGSVLGAVKMKDYMPWDYDGDLAVHKSNITFFHGHKNYFKQRGMELRFKYSKKTKLPSSFYIYTPEMWVEVVSVRRLSVDSFGEPFRSTPTLVQLHGLWVHAPYSPGTYARGKYGVEILRHAHSSMQSGADKNGVYNSGYFHSCRKPGHHACLDSLRADGNIHFHIPQGCC